MSNSHPDQAQTLSYSDSQSASHTFRLTHIQAHSYSDSVTPGRSHIQAQTHSDSFICRIIRTHRL